MTITLLDHTRCEAARTCMRKFYYKMERGWNTNNKSSALTFGSSYHAAMDCLWARHTELYQSKASRQAVVEAAYEAFVKEWMEQGFNGPDDLGPDEIDQLLPRTPGTALEMLHEYPDAREHLFRDPSFKLIAVEQPFIVPIDPDNDKTWYCGRFDKLFEYRGEIIVGEHKTTATYSGTKKTKYHLKSNYIDSWSLHSQIFGYCYALRQLHGDKSGGVWIDAALVHREVHDVFRFIPINVKDVVLDAWLWNLHTVIDTILANRAVVAEREGGPYLAAYPHNFHSCTDFGGICEYADICRSVNNPAQLTEPPSGYVYDPWNPFSILNLQEIGITPNMTNEIQP